MKGGLILVMVLLLVVPLAQGATISGAIYDYSLQQVDNVIITVDSVPPQKYIAKEGTYHFSIDFGEYQLDAKYYEDNILQAQTSEPIIIDREGDFVVDLILEPSYDEEQTLFDEMDAQFDPYQEKKSPLKIIFILATILLFTLIVYYIRKTKLELKLEQQKNKDAKKGSESEDEEDVEIIAADRDEPEGDKYYLEIKALVEKHQRITQKEIRKHVPLSEAKVSLVISELEENGLIAKIKKGRGNIIVWKGPRDIEAPENE